METWEHEVDALLNDNITGSYTHCCVTQIVIVEKNSNEAWNYFTHIHFSSEYKTEKESVLLTTPATIRKRFVLFISQYTMNKEKFRSCVQTAVPNKIWDYSDSKITCGQKLDTPFISHLKFVSENVPVGSLYQNVIPLEESLYGSNFMGNYYIFEIFSGKDYINGLLQPEDVYSIQSEIKKCKLNYRLDKMSDRIGNVVCRFDVEALEAKPVKLGERGTEYQFKLPDTAIRETELHIHIEQEHDRLIYNCSDEDIVLKPGDFIQKGVLPNQWKTTITVSDKRSGLLLFRIVSDQSVNSNYRSQITPATVFASAVHDCRKIVIDGKEVTIPLSSVKLLGSIDLLLEMAEASKRQQRWDDVFFKEQHYFNFYHSGEHDRAIQDIRSILNSQLLWDLQEVWIIDPYLSAKDIIETAFFCEKPNIVIKCLTDIRTIMRNRSTKEEIISSDDSSICDYFAIKKRLCEEIKSALGHESDIRLSFRSAYAANGSSFHDRYIILQYEINKTRVWSLGTSINSVGKSHHIIQIVESPELIADFFREEWRKTEALDCKIYDYSDNEREESNGKTDC